MSTNITPTSVRLGATIPIPADTDTADSASIAQFVQPLANAIKYGQAVMDIWVPDLTTPAEHNAIYNGTFVANFGLATDATQGGAYVGPRKLRALEMPDANTTVLTRDYDLVAWYWDSAPAAGRNLILDTTGMIEGWEIEIANCRPDRNLHVTATPNALAPGFWNVIANSSSNPSRLRLIFDGTRLRIVSVSGSV